jgi:hypothetical protein
MVVVSEAFLSLPATQRELPDRLRTGLRFAALQNPLEFAFLLPRREPDD